MKFKIGTEYLSNNGLICMVIDLDFNGQLLVKFKSKPNGWFVRRLNKEGKDPFYDCFSIASEAPKTREEYVILYATPDDSNKLKIWSRLQHEPSDETIEKVKKEMGSYKFYGVQKIVYESDGTKDRINF